MALWCIHGLRMHPNLDGVLGAKMNLPPCEGLRPFFQCMIFLRKELFNCPGLQLHQQVFVMAQKPILVGAVKTQTLILKESAVPM